MDTSFASSQPDTRALWYELALEHARAARRNDASRALPGLVARPSTAAYSAWSVSAGKRVIDIAGALLLLLLCWPLLLLICALVWLSSPGPIIFRQERVGRGERLFTVFKFRTMEQLCIENGGLSHTKRGDRRITRVGSILRRYKLDELPQIFNVLKGDMSLVGPRPKLPHHEIMKMPFRPGLTGAATLVFRCEEEMLQHIPDHELEAYYARTIKPLKAKLDWDYMRQATLFTDLTLLYYTAAACLFQAASGWQIDLSKLG